jgi:beta-lactamase regulating signal transducer with metallopeptidase domain/DUF4097 and DUF4098 domain-containing protein YvlB
MNLPSASFISAILLVLKVTVVFSLAGLVSAFLRGRSAAARHVVWLASLVGVLALLPLTALAPRLAVSLPAAAERALAQSAPAATDARVSASPGDVAIVPRVPSAAAARGTSLGASHASVARRPSGAIPLLALVWLAGVAGVLLWSVFGHLGLWALHRSALPVERSAWERHHGLEPPATGAGHRVRLALSSVVGTPLTWGFWKPIVLLPSRSSSWPLERRRAALLHELAHVERDDYLAQLVATLACAVYWFHPLTWWATGRLRSESEHACDDRVLAAGTPAPEYASDLLAVAHGARGPGGSRLVAIGMARRSHLEGRLLAVLDETRRRGAVRRFSGIATLAGTLLVLVPFAGLTPRLHAAAVAATPAVMTVVAENSTQTTTKHTSTTVNTLNSKSVVYKPKDEDEDKADDKHTLDDTIPVKPGGRLVLDLDTGGSVAIHGWDRNEVSVRFTLGGADWRTTQVASGPESFGVGIRAVPTGHQSYQSTSHRIEIRVPERYDVRIHSAGGGVTIDGVEGTFEGVTGGGELVLTDDRGRASLSTGGGDIQVSDCDLGGSVSTGGGTVKLSRVKGGLRGSSGSGPVIYADADADGKTGDLSGVDVDGTGKVKLGDKPPGYLHISRAGGVVDLDEVPNGADIQTGGGDIRIAKGAGTIQARTGGGDVSVGPIAGSVSASTGAGDVRITLASVGGRGQSAQAWSGTGTVVVELPSDLNARIELETSYTNNFGRATKITSAWTVDRAPVTDWDDSEGTPRKFVRATGTAGKGEGLVHIQTVNGDIELRRVSR